MGQAGGLERYLVIWELRHLFWSIVKRKKRRTAGEWITDGAGEIRLMIDPDVLRGRFKNALAVGLPKPPSRLAPRGPLGPST